MTTAAHCRGRGRSAKTAAMLDTAVRVLTAHHPMTVRQVYYQLVSAQVIENNRSQYQAVSKLLVEARKSGDVLWKWVEDRLRRPRTIPMWEGPADFAECVVPQYRRGVWSTQPCYVECWLEKDALSGIFEDELEPYGITLNVGRGYDGWDSIRNASERYKQHDQTYILYFGDFDPSGEDMVRSLRERLGYFATSPEIIKCALTDSDIAQYNLPPDPTKLTDTRRTRFIAEHGDRCVELDALPVDVLRERICMEVEKRMDMDALAKVTTHDAVVRQQLAQLLESLSG